MPAATTVNVAVCPVVTVWLAGGVVIVGSLAAGVPDSRSAVIVEEVSSSLLVLAIPPESFPAGVGENDKFNLAAPSGATVLGVVTPETPMRCPNVEINKMFRFAPRALVNVNTPLTVVLTAALPKFKLVELALVRGRRWTKALNAFSVERASNQA